MTRRLWLQRDGKGILTYASSRTDRGLCKPQATFRLSHQCSVRSDACHSLGWESRCLYTAPLPSQTRPSVHWRRDPCPPHTVLLLLG